MYTRQQILLFAALVLTLVLFRPGSVAFAEKVIATVPVGNNPIAIEVNPTTNRIYVTNAADTDDTVSVINGATNLVTTIIPVSGGPNGIGVNPITNRIYTSNARANNMSVIDGATNQVIDSPSAGAFMRQVDVNPNTNKIYIAGQSAISVFDGLTNILTQVPVVPTTYLLGAGVNTWTNKVYFSDSETGDVIVLDGSTNIILKTIPLGVGPNGGGAHGIGVNPVTNKIYVAEPNSKTVSVIDGVTDSVISIIPLGARPFCIGVNPSTNRIYVSLDDLNPTADAGPDQSVFVGDLVTLDGSGSTANNSLIVIDGVTDSVAKTVPVGSTPYEIAVNPLTNMIYVANSRGNSVTVIDGTLPDEDPLTFSWSFTSRPPGSTAMLDDPSSVNPSFTADKLGNYTLNLVVTDSLGLASQPDSVLVSTSNTPPVADAGPDQSVIVIGTSVQLNGTQSYDLEGDPISYSWTIIQKPAGSLAALSNPTSPNPNFIADIHGTYVVQLVVSDPWISSVPDTVTISFTNVKPVANAGGNQAVSAGDTVYLIGAGSSDANGDLLTYNWSFVARPMGSSAVVIDPTASVASFMADVAGQYIVSLVVNDGFVSSDPDNATITATSLMNSLINKLKELINGINNLNNLNPSVFKNRNMANTLTNKVNAVIGMIEQGLYSDALDKLTNDILAKTNGCASSGLPDNNDWITDCYAQNLIYSLTQESINLLKLLQAGG